MSHHYCEGEDDKDVKPDTYIASCCTRRLAKAAIDQHGHPLSKGEATCRRRHKWTWCPGLQMWKQVL